MIANYPAKSTFDQFTCTTSKPIFDTYKGKPVYIPTGYMVRVTDKNEATGAYYIVALVDGKLVKTLAFEFDLNLPQATTEPIDSNEPLVPRIYQEYGITFLLSKGAAILADAPGVGKTLQSLEAAYRACIALEKNIDPLSLCYNQDLQPLAEGDTHPTERPEWANYTETWSTYISTFNLNVAVKTSTFPAHISTKSPTVVIVAPSHLCGMWFKTIRRQYPNEHVALATDDTRNNRLGVLEPGCRFYIVNYEMMRHAKPPKESDYIMVDLPFTTANGQTYMLKEKKLKPGYVQPKTYLDALAELNPLCVIFDESHRLKSHKSKQAKASAELALTVPYRFLLSATPIKREADDLFWQLHIVDPISFPQSHNAQFLYEYCFYKTTAYGKKNIQLKDSAKRRLWFNRIESLETSSYDSGLFTTAKSNKKYNTSFTSPNTNGYILGRSYKDVGLYLPPVIPATIPVQMDTTTRALYDSLRRSYRMQFVELGEEIEVSSLMAMLHGLRILTACPNKYEAVKQLIEDNEGPHVLYCEYKPSGQFLAQMLNTTFISGDVPESERESLCASLLAEGKPVVGMGRVIGTGINALSQAKVIINFENDYTPGERTQRIGRVQRYDPYRPTGEPILLFDVLVTDSIDERVYEAQRDRGKSIKDVITVELGIA